MTRSSRGHACTRRAARAGPRPAARALVAVRMPGGTASWSAIAPAAGETSPAAAPFVVLLAGAFAWPRGARGACAGPPRRRSPIAEVVLATEVARISWTGVCRRAPKPLLADVPPPQRSSMTWERGGARIIRRLVIDPWPSTRRIGPRRPRGQRAINLSARIAGGHSSARCPSTAGLGHFPTAYTILGDDRPGEGEVSHISPPFGAARGRAAGGLGRRVPSCSTISPATL